MINKHLFVLLACVFVVMIGVGITMPVLPFYVERLAPDWRRLARRLIPRLQASSDPSHPRGGDGGRASSLAGRRRA